MGKQLFAKVVVFALVLGNLGAYYFFWPAHAPNPFSTETTPGRTTLKRDDAAPAAPAGEIILPSRPDLVPGAPAETTLPTPLLVKAAAETPPATVPIPDPGSLPMLPTPAAPGGFAERKEPDPMPTSKETPTSDQQRMLESLKQAQLEKPGSTEPAPTGAPAVPPQDTANSPWSITHIEFPQGRTLLRVRLHKSAEFKVLCDRMELKAPDGAVQAVGKVTLTGPGVTASCQRLSLPLGSEQIVLEGQAEAKIHDAPQAAEKEAKDAENRPAWELKGERLALRPAGAVRWQNTAEATPPPASAEGQAIRPAAGTDLRWLGTPPGQDRGRLQPTEPLVPR